MPFDAAAAARNLQQRFDAQRQRNYECLCAYKYVEGIEAESINTQLFKHLNW